MSGKGNKGERGGIVIRKEEVVEGGHHGGAWKVAYADFVTAMMAFFLLMWLLNATTEEQRRGLADYFTPNNAVSNGNSGNGKPFGGRSTFETGAMVSDRGTQAIRDGIQSSLSTPMDVPDAENAPDDDEAAEEGGLRSRSTGGAGGQARSEQRTPGQQAPGGGAAPTATTNPTAGQHAQQTANKADDAEALRRADAAAFRAEQERREREAFQKAAEQIRDAVRSDPRLADLASQLMIDMTQEGLRIQLVDAERKPMFPTGVANVNERAKLLLQKIAPVLAKLPEDIAISGHTDAEPFRGEGRSNWELSADRANATRRLLVEAGLGENRFKRVTGVADRDPLVTDDPFAAANRRIAITVLKAPLTP